MNLICIFSFWIKIIIINHEARWFKEVKNKVLKIKSLKKKRLKEVKNKVLKIKSLKKKKKKNGWKK